MRRDWKYLFYVVAIIGVYLLVTLTGPKQHNWQVTLAHEDKEPYGTFALNQLLPNFFEGHAIENSYQTLYEKLDTTHTRANILILTARFAAGKEDVDILLNHLARGNSAIISAQTFSGPLADTLQVSTYDFLFRAAQDTRLSDSLSLYFLNGNDTAQYFYSQRSIHNYFDSFDSTRSEVLAVNEFLEPVLIKVKWGAGNLFLNTTPLIFTNINLLDGNNHRFVAENLSLLPAQDVFWSEFYHLGRREAATPLRFILTTEPLRWAYYLTVVSLLLFILFEAKRKQRIIPVVKPLANTTLEFATTIGNLYYQRGDHKNMAEKRIAFFLDQLREKYWIETAIHSHAVEAIARKTGNNLHTTATLFNHIDRIHRSANISSDELKNLNMEIEAFLAR